MSKAKYLFVNDDEQTIPKNEFKDKTSYINMTNKIELNECYPKIDVIKAIAMLPKDCNLLNNPNKVYTNKPNRVDGIIQLSKKIKKNQNSIKVNYSKKVYKINKAKSLSIGRLYPDFAHVYQNLGQLVRRLVINDTFEEYDIKNSQPTILYQKCEELKLPKSYYSAIKDYVNDRDAKINDVKNEYKVSKDQAKSLFIILCFGGTFNTWLKQHQLSPHREPQAFITEFNNNLLNIRTNLDKFGDSMQECFDVVQSKEYQKQHSNTASKEACALALYLQNTEGDILKLIYNEYKDQVISFIHDSVIMQKQESPEQTKNNLQNLVKDSLNIDVIFEQKSLTPTAVDKTIWEDIQIESEQNKPDDLLDLFIKFAQENNFVKQRIINGKGCSYSIMITRPETPYWAEKDKDDRKQIIPFQELFANFAKQVEQSNPDIFLQQLVKKARCSYLCIEDFLCYNHYHPCIPVIKKDRYKVGFLDGVLDINFDVKNGKSFVFLPTADVPKGTYVRQLYHMNYEEALNSPTPYWDKLLDYQMEQDVRDCFEGLLGRLFYDVLSKDNWEVIPNIRGPGGAGKTQVLRVVRQMFQRQDMAFVDTGTSKSFPLQGKNKDLLICADAQDLERTLVPDIFKSMASGDGVDMNIKYEDPQSIDWITPVIIASNAKIYQIDDSGIIRRICEIPMHKAVPDDKKDLKLEDKLAGEVPAIFLKLIKKYELMVKSYGDKSFWSCCPTALVDLRDENKADQNHLNIFLEEGIQGTLELEADKIMTWHKFEKVYKDWLKHTYDIKIDKIDKVLNNSTLASHGIQYIKPVMVCSKCKQPPNRGSCCNQYDPKSKRDTIPAQAKGIGPIMF